MRNRNRVARLTIGFYVFGGVALADPPRQLDLNDSGDASAALLFLQLHNAGLAGGSSGVCLDLSYEGGKPRYRAAFDTEAFVTGKSDLRSGGGLDAEGLKKLARAISAASGGTTNVSIDGYADGQHFQTEGYSVEKSIKSNQELATDRARAIEALFSGEPGIKVTGAAGHASPYWERQRPGKSEGLNCPTRRKVVVSFDAPDSKIASKVSGGRLGAPAKLPPQIRSKINQEFIRAIRESAKALSVDADMGGLGRRKVEKDVEAVFDSMMKASRISSACIISPFKEITKAKIESVIKNTAMSVALKTWLTPTGYKVNAGGGNPAIESGCFVPSNEVKAGISKIEGYSVSGADLVRNAKLSSTNGEVAIGYSAKSMDLNSIEKGPNRKQKLRGYYCSACGHGLFFHEDPHSGSFKPQYLDRVIESKEPAMQEKFIKALNEFENADPFAVASMVKPRMFLIRNCRDCQCDHASRIKSGDASVSTFDPVQGDSPDQNVPVAALQDTCMIRPPVVHACNVRASGGDGKDEGKLKQELQYQMALQSLEVTGADINELVNKVDQACPSSSKKLPLEKIKDVQCDPERGTQIPSDDEKVDCDRYDRLSPGKGAGSN